MTDVAIRAMVAMMTITLTALGCFLENIGQL